MSLINTQNSYLRSRRVLIAVSKTKTVEEKLEALQYLVDKYSEDEFGTEKVCADSCVDERASFRDTVIESIRIWSDILRQRKDSDGYVYAVVLEEKEYHKDNLRSYSFFSSYDKAYQNMVSEKQEYLDDEDLRDVKTFGEILRIKLDNQMAGYTEYDQYLFDNELRLIKVSGQTTRVAQEDRDYGFADNYSCYVPLPFVPGDIVKRETPFYDSLYGVFFHEWLEPKEKFFISLEVSLDVYDEENKVFAYTDDTCILNLAYCTDDELPENQWVLKLLREVRKGRLDFYNILHWCSRDDLDGLRWAIK